MNLPLPSAGTVDPWPEILHLLPQKITYRGQPVAGPPETLRGFVAWLMQQMPAVVGSGDPASKAQCFLLWLRGEVQPYEADDATRMAKAAAVTTAPPNPISDQTVAQQAQPPAPPAAAAAADGAEAESGPGMVCPECGTKVSGMRGYKRHVTMTHKTEWPAFCQKHGLDQKTGMPSGAAPIAAAAPVAAAVPPPPAAAPVPPMFGSAGQASGGTFVAPAPPPAPLTGTAAPPPTIPATAPPMFQQQSFIQPPAPPAPPAMPQPQSFVGAPPQPPQALLTQPQQPAFVPPQQQAFQQPQPVFAPPQQPAFTPPQQPQAPAAGPIVAFNPTAAAPPAAAPATLGAPTRESMAQMLGGAVDLVVVKLLDAANVKPLLDGRMDVNQIAHLAEARARAEMKVQDLAQASYGAGKQAAQRHFAELLTATPSCYLLLNGYDPILPDGYLSIIAARTTKYTVITDGGRQATPIF